MLQRPLEIILLTGLCRHVPNVYSVVHSRYHRFHCNHPKRAEETRAVESFLMQDTGTVDGSTSIVRVPCSGNKTFLIYSCDSPPLRGKSLQIFLECYEVEPQYTDQLKQIFFTVQYTVRRVCGSEVVERLFKIGGQNLTTMKVYCIHQTTCVDRSTVEFRYNNSRYNNNSRFNNIFWADQTLLPLK